MPVDPKYADLPWIAHDQPDIYEAGDLPEVDQKLFGDEVGDSMMPKEIENIRLSVDDAHKRFASCKVDSTNVDFSDSISGTGRIGYTIDTNEYEILPPNARENEPLLSRLQRLQTEVAQLVHDVGDFHEKSKDDHSLIMPTSLLKSAESLGEQLKQINLQDIGDTTGLFGDRRNATLTQIIQQIESLEFTKPSERKPEESTHVVYEIYDNHHSFDSVDLEKVADLDRRIQHLEALIGQPDPVKLSALTADVAQHSLLDAVARLSARSALLQPSHLDMVESRLTGLQAKLQAITEKREAISDADTQNKVAELYQLVKTWNDVADGLPMVVERLSELKELHEEASEFSNILMSVEVSQKSVESQLGAYSKLLEEVKNSWNENLQIVKNNLSSLEARLN